MCLHYICSGQERRDWIQAIRARVEPERIPFVQFRTEEVLAWLERKRQIQLNQISSVERLRRAVVAGDEEGVGLGVGVGVGYEDACAHAVADRDSENEAAVNVVNLGGSDDEVFVMS